MVPPGMERVFALPSIPRAALARERPDIDLNKFSPAEREPIISFHFSKLLYRASVLAVLVVGALTFRMEVGGAALMMADRGEHWAVSHGELCDGKAEGATGRGRRTGLSRCKKGSC